MTPAAVLLRRTLPSLLIVSVVAGLVTAVLTARSRPGVDVALTFTVPVPAVSVPRSAEGSAVPLDVLQASEKFAGTLLGWLNSPDVVVATYRRAPLSLPERATVRQLARTFTAVQRGGATLDVRFRVESETEARALATALVGEMQSRVDAFNAASENVHFRAVAGDPLIIPVVVSPLLRGAVAVVVVCVLGINLVLLKDLFRASE